MWLRAKQTTAERDLVRRELRLAQLENQLSEAAIDAGRGEYEEARQTASGFFISLESQLNSELKTDLSPTQQQKLANVLIQRDQIIALLAHSNPIAAASLSDLYVYYRQIMQEKRSHDGASD